jgi:excinuclease UvrABC nuclease subunit
MADYIDWLGRSGKSYRYWFLDINQPIKDEAGNYMFVQHLPTGRYLPAYIGQADSLRKRLPGHERLEDAKLAGATHVMSHTTPAGEQARLDEERDLIQYWNPPLNVQHRKVQ